MRLQTTYGLILIIVLLSGCSKSETDSSPQVSLEKTENYIAQLSLTDLAELAVQTESDKYSPDRIPSGVSYNLYYDQDLLTSAIEDLRYVDRISVLQHIFQEVKGDSSTELETHLRILSFTSQVIVHYLQPQNAQGFLVYDPLLLLKLGEGRCGQVARLAVDLYLANGYPARVVQLGGHVIAEVYWDNDWHYMDPDIFSHRNTVLIGGTIPSLKELSQHPELLDKLPSFLEINPAHRGGWKSAPYPSYFYFSESAYGNTVPAFYWKSDVLQQVFDMDFNWNFYSYEANSTLDLNNEPLRYMPRSPIITQVSNISGSDYYIEWSPSVDVDGDFLHYRVYLSSESRGWNYPVEYYPDTATYMTSYPLDSATYTKRTEVIDSNLGYYEVTNPNITVTIAQDTYISVEAVDVYGNSIGREVFLPSQEIKIEP